MKLMARRDTAVYRGVDARGDDAAGGRGALLTPPLPSAVRGGARLAFTRLGMRHGAGHFGLSTCSLFQEGACIRNAVTPVLGRREQDQRNRFVLRTGLSLANFDAASSQASSTSGVAASPSTAPDAQAVVAKRIGNRDSGLTWEALRELRSMTRLPIVLKGVLRYDDARRAAEEGYGIWVSNHGGRQLDYAPGTLEALPEVVAGAAGRVPVVFDGGIRRGTDMLKAFALGASFVFVGRPLVWALGAGGEEGVARLLAMLEVELKNSMALAGCPDLRSATRDLVQLPGERPPRPGNPMVAPSPRL